MYSNSQGASLAPAAELGVEWGSPLERRITSMNLFPPYK